MARSKHRAKRPPAPGSRPADAERAPVDAGAVAGGNGHGQSPASAAAAARYTQGRRSQSTAASRRGGRGLLYLGVALALLLLSGIVGVWLTGGFSNLTPPPAMSGVLLVPEPRGAVSYNLANGTERMVLAAPTDGWVNAVDATRTGRRFAIQVYEPPAASGVGTSRIVILEADGSQRVAAEPELGEFLADPVWNTDGDEIFFTRRLIRRPNPDESKQRLERVDLTTGQRTVILDNAYSADLVPDGTALVALRETNEGVALSVVPLGGGAPRDLIPSGQLSIISPRVSPDGRLVAFGMINSSETAAFAGDPLAWLGESLVPSVAAHGIPYDIYLVPVDGSAPPRRLTNFNQDSPFPAWSPDGKWIMIRAEYNQFLSDAASGATWQLNANGGIGTIDWAPE